MKPGYAVMVAVAACISLGMAAPAHAGWTADAVAIQAGSVVGPHHTNEAIAGPHFPTNGNPSGGTFAEGNAVYPATETMSTSSADYSMTICRRYVKTGTAPCITVQVTLHASASTDYFGSGPSIPIGAGNAYATSSATSLGQTVTAEAGTVNLLPGTGVVISDDDNPIDKKPSVVICSTTSICADVSSEGWCQTGSYIPGFPAIASAQWATVSDVSWTNPP